MEADRNQIIPPKPVSFGNDSVGMPSEKDGFLGIHSICRHCRHEAGPIRGHRGFALIGGGGRVADWENPTIPFRPPAALLRDTLPKIASNNRLQGTPEENKAIVGGSLVFFGTYSVNGTDLNVRVEGSSFPNWEQTNQKRTDVSVSGDELKYTQPAPSGGGPAAVVTWKRAK
jgi:hypothetical protein